MSAQRLDASPSSLPVFSADLGAVATACAFAVALLLCARHSDLVALAALLELAAISAVLLGVHRPPEAQALGKAHGDGRPRTTRVAHICLARRHCLPQ